MVSTSELLSIGFSRDQIAQRVRMGLLHRVHHGVYAIGRPQLSFEGYCRAAWLACGPGSAISHISAARAWGIRQSTGAVHVCAPRGRKGHPGLVVHRPRLFTPDDVERRDGYAVTTLARTIVDMSPGRSVDTVGRWIHEAGVQRVLDVREVWETIERLRHHRGSRVVEAALALEVAPTRSGLEDLFLSISRRARMPKPNVNERLWSGTAWEEVDFHYPTLGLIVEVDGARYHASRWRRRRDAEKDERFRAAAKVVWRVPELDITLGPDSVATELRRLRAALGRSKSAPSRLSSPVR